MAESRGAWQRDYAVRRDLVRELYGDELGTARAARARVNRLFGLSEDRCPRCPLAPNDNEGAAERAA